MKDQLLTTETLAFAQPLHIPLRLRRTPARSAPTSRLQPEVPALALRDEPLAELSQRHVAAERKTQNYARPPLSRAKIQTKMDARFLDVESIFALDFVGGLCFLCLLCRMSP
jgi:hypothetical protein